MKHFDPTLSGHAVRLASKRAIRFDQSENLIARRCGAELRERLELITIQPQAILDLGGGMGLESRELANKYPEALVVGLDNCFDAACDLTSVAQPDPWLACFGDAHELPFKDHCFDFVFANLILPWTDSTDALKEVARVLKPGGLLLLSTFGPDTLIELRAAWAEVDNKPHGHAFIDMHDLGDTILQAGFLEPVMDADVVGLTYLSVEGLVRDLRMLGGTNALVDRRRSLTGNSRWQAFESGYWASAGDSDRLRATFELIYGVAWARIPPDDGERSIEVKFGE